MYKAIEFLNNRRPDLEIRASFIQQLSRYEKRLEETYKGNQTENWTELASKPNLENEELIITNTFLNSQMRPFADDSHLVKDKEQLQSKVQWIDKGKNDKNKLVTNTNMVDLLDKDDITQIISHRESDIIQTSILKPVAHIHPKDYNFVVKDGHHLKQINEPELELQEESETDNLKSHSFDKTSE